MIPEPLPKINDRGDQNKPTLQLAEPAAVMTKVVRAGGL